MIKKFFIICFLFISVKSSALETSAKQAYLIDVLSGEVLFEKNKEQKISPASITKIMTAIVAFDLIKKGDLKLEEKIKVSKMLGECLQRDFHQCLLCLMTELALKIY